MKPNAIELVWKNLTITAKIKETKKDSSGKSKSKEVDKIIINGI